MQSMDTNTTTAPAEVWNAYDIPRRRCKVTLASLHRQGIHSDILREWSSLDATRQSEIRTALGLAAA